MTLPELTPADWQRDAALYLPLSAVAIARLLIGSRPRLFVSVLLSILWSAPALLVLQVLNQFAHWWTFAPGSQASLRGMPGELYLGWIVLWAVLPQLAPSRLSLTASAALLIALDCLLMPLASAAIHLSRTWVVGEMVAVFLVLLPALALGRWTRDHTHLSARAALQLLTAGLIFLFLLPELIFSLTPGAGWSPLFAHATFAFQVDLQLVFLLALPGISASFEFVHRGHGTPIPYDPPQRLVTSGIYRFVANPMQLSCTLVLLAWSILLANGWMLAAALVSFAYSAGIARWDEQQDLGQRFGEPWQLFRANVHDWRLRWRPFHAGEPAVLYIAATCGPCSEIRRWLKARHPVGLILIDAETLPAGSIRRLRYDPADGTPPEEGIRAFARALEHLHLGWALAGCALRLPVVWLFAQTLTDAGGLGPRTLQSFTSSAASK